MITVLRLTSWNVNQKPLWDEAGDTDILLLQECPASLRDSDSWTAHPSDGDWTTGTSRWRTAVAIRPGTREVTAPRLSDLHSGETGVLQVSRSGSIAAVQVDTGGPRPLIVASVYARWEGDKNDAIYADANAHRLLSDLSTYITSTRPRYDLIVAGDWNILYGYGEDDHSYWKARYDSVFARAEALGLTYVGPQFPNGRQADPWPAELPATSLNVPTYYTRNQQPATASRQLDHVFVNDRLAQRVSVRALNGIEDWGPSDHCRIRIEVQV